MNILYCSYNQGQNTLSSLDQYMPLNSKNTEGECHLTSLPLPFPQMEVGAPSNDNEWPHPLKMCYQA